jgi:Adenosine-5'-phosphosulfate reductase beta subunit
MNGNTIPPCGCAEKRTSDHLLEDQVPRWPRENFVSPIRTTPWGSIKSPADYEAPSAEAMKSQQLAHEPEALKVTALPALSRDRFKQGLR